MLDTKFKPGHKVNLGKRNASKANYRAALTRQIFEENKDKILTAYRDLFKNAFSEDAKDNIEVAKLIGKHFLTTAADEKNFEENSVNNSKLISSAFFAHNFSEQEIKEFKTMAEEKLREFSQSAISEIVKKRTPENVPCQ